MGGGDTVPAICRTLYFSLAVTASGGALAFGAGFQEPFGVDRVSRAFAIDAGDVAFTCTRRAYFSSHKSPPK